MGDDFFKEQWAQIQTYLTLPICEVVVASYK